MRLNPTAAALAAKTKHVLIVDDEESICWGLRRLLVEDGHEVSIASSAEEAFELAGQCRPDLIVMDVRLPGLDGITAMQRIRERIGDVPIIIITAFGNLETAVAAVKHGAADYLTKPFDLPQVVSVLRRALGAVEPASKNADADADVALRPDERTPLPGELLGASPAMQQVFKRIAVVAASDLPVLITGESGTGKELVARAIYRHSRRAERPFVPIHLAALSPSLVESELFGHVRGAFTGAEQARTGLLELAGDATAFFDETGDIPLGVQAKLLRVLEQRELIPVGGNVSRPCDFRVIAATSRDLHRDIADGVFRQDLYFRLAAFEIQLPPLRERVDDIPMLAAHFLRSSRVTGARDGQLTESALAELRRRPWPGNVRELRSAVEHGVILARGGPIGPEHLPPALMLSASSPATTPEEALRNAIREWVAEHLRRGATLEGFMHERMLQVVEPPLFELVLEHTGQNRVAAAEILGIHRATLRKKMR